MHLLVTGWTTILLQEVTLLRTCYISEMLIIKKITTLFVCSLVLTPGKKLLLQAEAVACTSQAPGPGSAVQGPGSMDQTWCVAMAVWSEGGAPSWPRSGSGRGQGLIHRARRIPLDQTLVLPPWTSASWAGFDE